MVRMCESAGGTRESHVFVDSRQRQKMREARERDVRERGRRKGHVFREIESVLSAGGLRDATLLFA